MVFIIRKLIWLVKNDVEYFEDMIFVLCDRSTFGICKSDLCLWKVYAETAGPFGSTVFFNQTWSTQSISINNGWVFDENYKLCEDWTCAWLWDILYFKISGGQKSEVGMKKNSMTEHPADAWAGELVTLLQFPQKWKPMPSYHFVIMRSTPLLLLGNRKG